MDNTWFEQWQIQKMQGVQSLLGLPPLAPPHEEPPQDSSESDEMNQSDEYDEVRRTVFCANLDDRVTEELLYEAFLQAGPIEKLRIPLDNNGKQRSFGFVTYVHQCTVPYAVKLMQGLQLFRRTLTIRAQDVPSSPQPQRQRHSLPSDCERMNPRHNNRNSFDNVALRGSGNPFGRSANDWVKGSRSHPYQRNSDHQRRSLPDRSHSDNRNHHHHNGSNRRSEQRSSQRR